MSIELKVVLLLVSSRIPREFKIAISKHRCHMLLRTSFLQWNIIIVWVRANNLVCLRSDKNTYYNACLFLFAPTNRRARNNTYSTAPIIAYKWIDVYISNSKPLHVLYYYILQCSLNCNALNAIRNSSRII